jgi:hypothetical protein
MAQFCVANQIKVFIIKADEKMRRLNSALAYVELFSNSLSFDLALDAFATHLGMFRL